MAIHRRYLPDDQVLILNDMICRDSCSVGDMDLTANMTTNVIGRCLSPRIRGTSCRTRRINSMYAFSVKECVKWENKQRKGSIHQVLVIQVALSFVVIAVLIILGGVLVFHEMGTEYTHDTSVGFIAAVYLAFIAFQPAGTLFAARKEFIEGKVDLPAGTADAPSGPPVNPWTATLPLSVPVAVICTTAAAVVIYGYDWKPSPVATVMVSLLYVIPHYLITARFMKRDLLGMSAGGLGSEPVSSIRSYFWGTFVLPNIIFQTIVNTSISNRGFHHEAMKLATAFPAFQGLVPVNAVALDLAVTFMFVCNFTFLAATTYTASGVSLGIIPLHRKVRGKGMHGFLFFLLMLIMGLIFGVGYGSALHARQIENISFTAAMLSKVACVIIAVYLGSIMALHWSIKKMKAHRS